MLKISISEAFPLPLPEGHKFPFRKYELTRQQLEYEGIISAENVFHPELISDEIIHLTHDAGWWQKAKSFQLDKKEYRRIGFPNVPELISRSWSSVSGTVKAAEHALEDGAGMNLAGGTHHSFFDRGEGFCLLNDIGIAANYLLHKGLVKDQPGRKILIVDLDVHQGNGTAEIFRNEPRVFTFSMHCRVNYPLEKETSDLDLEVEPFTEDAAYLKMLTDTLPGLIEEVKPDFAFYLSGVDIVATDKLGKLNVSRAGCMERDRFVFQQLRNKGIPVVVSMGGGYSPRLVDIVEAHCNTYRVAQEMYF
ncbi:UNVERIFIED_CONTAM: hypothetical protein GTU68_031016 [Idotea baltica]|nr:hypothetical protein [Idotea baltica]